MKYHLRYFRQEQCRPYDKERNTTRALVHSWKQEYNVFKIKCKSNTVALALAKVQGSQKGRRVWVFLKMPKLLGKVVCPGLQEKWLLCSPSSLVQCQRCLLWSTPLWNYFANHCKYHVFYKTLPVLIAFALALALDCPVALALALAFALALAQP